jgi:hypothetical protein
MALPSMPRVGAVPLVQKRNATSNLVERQRVASAVEREEHN